MILHDPNLSLHDIDSGLFDPQSENQDSDTRSPLKQAEIPALFPPRLCPISPFHFSDKQLKLGAGADDRTAAPLRREHLCFKESENKKDS